MPVYRANVSAYLPVDSNGNLQPNTTYQVRLTDGKNALSWARPSSSYTGTFARRSLKSGGHLRWRVCPSNTALIVRQKLQGFYQPGDQSTSVAKFTAIVANGQSNRMNKFT